MSTIHPKISIRGSDAGAPPDPSDTASLIVLGDLMLCGEWDDVTRRGDAAAAFHDLGELCRGHDLVFANLEATVDGNEGTIAKEPRLIGEPKTLTAALETIGVDLACLANNHAFDANPAGFQKVRELLEEREILHLGAGLDAEAAGRSLVIERGGVRFGWLAYTALDTRPSHVATAGGPGVNPLREDVALAEIAELRGRVDHVIVSLHWGVEYCHLPSPEQIRLARGLVDAGVSLVVGHHAHVTQGTEVWGDGVIIYNLGNVVTTDLFVGDRKSMYQNRRRRSSYAVRAMFTRERLEGVELVSLYAPHGRVLVDNAHARRILERANRRLAAGVSAQQWKVLRFYEDVLRRTLRKLHPQVIRSIRLRHFATFFRNITLALRGRGPA